MTDGTEAALRELSGEVGKLTGRMEGNNQRMDDLGREIGQLRGLIEKRDSCCSTCRSEIDDKITLQDTEISGLKTHQQEEKAVSTWFDTKLGRIAMGIGIVTGLGSMLIGAVTALIWLMQLWQKVA